MKKQQFAIAGGNTTLLVWDCPLSKRKTIIEKYLPSVEQIGFVTLENNVPSLEMMGGELCINATLALASTLGESGVLYTSGNDSKVLYVNTKYHTSITITLRHKRFNKTILFPGIGFIVSKKRPINYSLEYYAKKYNVPAFGSIVVTRNTIEPTIFVMETNSVTIETACGSGSIATNIVYGLTCIQQPTGKFITVTKNSSSFTVQAKVAKI